MIKKRFTITQDFEEHHRQIRDNGHIIMGCFIEPQAEVIVNLLNVLHEENEQLKQYNKDLKEGLKDAEKRIEVQKWQLQVYREKEADLKQRLFEAKRDYLMETSDISDSLYIDEEMEQLRKEVDAL